MTPEELMNREAFCELMRKAGSGNAEASETKAAFLEMADAVAVPIKEAIFPDDLYSELVTMENWDARKDAPRYSTDLIAPGREKEFKSYKVPAHGELPERTVEPEYIRVDTFDVGTSIDFPRDLLASGDYDVMARAIYIMTEGLKMKMNDDVWHAALAAALGRGFIVEDTAAAVTTLTKRLLAKIQTKAKRSTGSSANGSSGFNVDRVYMSPELREQIIDFDNTKLDEVTRREVIMSKDGKIASLFGTELRSLNELGADDNSIYQDYWTDVLGGTLGTTGHSDTELLVGVDSSRKSQFVMPMVKKPVVEQDQGMARRNKTGLYVWLKYGVAVLDNRMFVPASC